MYYSGWEASESDPEIYSQNVRQKNPNPCIVINAITQYAPNKFEKYKENFENDCPRSYYSELQSIVDVSKVLQEIGFRNPIFEKNEGEICYRYTSKKIDYLLSFKPFKKRRFRSQKRIVFGVEVKRLFILYKFEEKYKSWSQKIGEASLSVDPDDRWKYSILNIQVPKISMIKPVAELVKKIPNNAYWYVIITHVTNDNKNIYPRIPEWRQAQR